MWGFSYRKQNVGNHWKHWVFGNLVDFVNTKYRKHHRPSSDEIIVIHQSEPIELRRLSEPNEMVQWPNWEGSSYYSVESEIKVSYTNRHSQTPLNTESDESPNSFKPQRTSNHSWSSMDPLPTVPLSESWKRSLILTKQYSTKFEITKNLIQ